MMNSYLLMPHVTADGVAADPFPSSITQHGLIQQCPRAQRRTWMLDDFSHRASVRGTVLHVLLTLSCSISSGMQGGMEHGISQ